METLWVRGETKSNHSPVTKNRTKSTMIIPLTSGEREKKGSDKGKVRKKEADGLRLRCRARENTRGRAKKLKEKKK